MTNQPPAKPPRRKDHDPKVKLEMMLRKTKRNGECMEWQGSYIVGLGKRRETWRYPQVYFRGKSWRGHRLVWTLIHGPPSDGMYVCHKCDNNRCINPAHLYLGTAKQNAQDTVNRGRHKSPKVTVCPNGHEYTAKNTRVDRRSDGRKYRRCLTCRREQVRIAGRAHDARNRLAYREFLKGRE